MRFFIAALLLVSVRACCADDDDDHCDHPLGTLKLLTWNVRYGLNGDISLAAPIEERVAVNAANLPRQASLIRQQEADFVTLNVVDNMTERSGGIDQTRLYSQLTGLDHFRYGHFFDFEDGGQYGEALLTRFGEATSSVVQLPKGQEEERVAVLYELDMEHVGPVIVVAVQLAYESDSMWRVEQAEALVARLNRNVPYIIMGDFNGERGPDYVWDDGKTIKVFQAAGFDILEKRGQKNTWNHLAPSMEIDHIIVRGSSLIDVKVEDGGLRVLDEREFSNHRPVVGTISFWSKEMEED